MQAMQQEEGLDNIQTAASDGKLEKVKGFLAAGIDINSQDETGYSAIHAATSYAHTELLKFLLSNGANVMLCDADGDTPLHGCEEPAVAQILIDAGAKLDAKNAEGKTPIEIAAEDERETMVGFLGTLYIQKQVPGATVNTSWQEQDKMDEDQESSPSAAKRTKSTAQ